MTVVGGQHWYKDPKTGKMKLSVINKTNDEGDWKQWENSLPSQFLSKQTKKMARQQLALSIADKESQLADIRALTNPTIKKYYLNQFADKCDADAMDLKAASLPGQQYHVLIANTTLKDTEVYAPNYRNGQKVALIRFPHGGPSEIPILTVNNKNARGKKLIGTDSIDAICINHKVAERLSGADFDGDAVMVIPTHDKFNRVKITSAEQIVKNFDNKLDYGTKERVGKNGKVSYINRYGKKIKVMTDTDNKMGVVSNLISDMFIQGAPPKELARALKHSMVVIDAAKHKLDYMQSEKDFKIQELKNKYQIQADGKIGGASTIVSRAKSPTRVPKTIGERRVNLKGKKWYDPTKPEGSKISILAPDNELYFAPSKFDPDKTTRTYTTTDGRKIVVNLKDKAQRDKYKPIVQRDEKGEVYITNKAGKDRYTIKMRTTESYAMKDVYDAEELMSKHRHPMERIYADHANRLKSLANNARVEDSKTSKLKYSSNARKVYIKEVESLTSKLADAIKNAGRERQATRIANVAINKILEKNRDEMDKDDIKKMKDRQMKRARNQVGAIPRRQRAINNITDKEWDAIQAGAISDSMLSQILRNSDPDKLRQRAMPKQKITLSTAKINRIKSMKNSNFTISEIAEKLGISVSTVSKYLNE